MHLIPYLQYTTGSVVGTLLLGVGYWQKGRRGFWGASLEVEQDSLLTPYLVFCWLAMVMVGLERSHGSLSRFYDFSFLSTLKLQNPWQKLRGYFQAFGWKADPPWKSLCEVIGRYSRATLRFLFGTPSQDRLRQAIFSPQGP